MKVNYLDLTDYLAIAAEVTGLGPVTLSRVTDLDLADFPNSPAPRVPNSPTLSKSHAALMPH
ncbi:MAG: hypothetical protein ACYDH5_12110 [Acidimicrobiales bacterium]